MKFGPLDVSGAEGAIIAHSVQLADRRLRKGVTLSEADIADLIAAGIAVVTVAAPGPDDIHEDRAAAMLARALVGKDAQNLRLSAPFTGRVNIYAETDGLLRVQHDAVNAFNAVDASITVATLPDLARVRARALVATVKIIPFAAPASAVAAASAVATDGLHLSPFSPRRVALVMTRTPGMAERHLNKGRQSVQRRLESLGCRMSEPQVVAHEDAALAQALTRVDDDLVLILTASATSDARDVGPAAVLAAGGELIRFGMPVDPGNLLFVARLDGRPVLGLPGCARSPALNGADWVLERLVAGIEVSADDIAVMGVGGLLKEIPTRPQPRGGVIRTPKRPRVEVILLAAGASRRMGAQDKLMLDIDGEALLRRTTKMALAAQVGRINVVLQPDRVDRADALNGLDINSVPAPDWSDGMSASLRAGLGAVSADCDAVIIVLADMPDVSADHLNRLVAAFDVREGREICQAVADNGRRGHPVLFGRRFFEALSNLSGDVGARAIVEQAAEFLTLVPTSGQGALVDLDTPADVARWRNS
ncbi:MAG: NTP transferase domain-containing protein [Paracoccaceae bacterium]